MKNLGEILKAQRKKRKLTYNQVYSRTKIQQYYIKALEQNDYSVFDGRLHAKGFLKIYAELLGLNVNQILALWRREYGYTFEDSFDIQESSSTRKLIKSLKNNIIITPTRIFVFLGTFLLLSFFGYLFYSYKKYSGPPALEIYSPENNAIAENSLIDITGKTDIDSVLFVNGERILLQPDGDFATSLNLREGVNTLSITSINKLDKKTEKVLTVLYRPHTYKNVEVLESSATSSDTP